MLFNSAAFIFYFLPVALFGFVALGRFGRRAVIGWLALMSIVFYGVWKPQYVIVLVGSMLMNFAISRMIAASRGSRAGTYWMVLGISLNLGILAYFKYLFRFLVFMNQMQFTQREWPHIILPLGISFFTFTQIAYLVDLRQGEAEKQDFISYALFVTFFPHLIAGPILHHKEMMPQFAAEKRYRLDWHDFATGLSWFVLGLAKKVVIADRIAPFADAAFAAPHGLGMWSAWIGVLNYSMQLYFDFSGYSDMAVGLARMFSIRFPYNFNSPYKATNIIDFWARWHMTLTRYLTLYLYNPVALAVSRRRLARGLPVSKKASRTAAGFVTMIAFPTCFTMFLAGVWHGAGLQFVIFGLLHAVYLSVNHGWRLWQNKPATAPRRWYSAPLGLALTYLCVVVSQVFFRADSTRDALALLAGMVGLHGMGLPTGIAAHLHLNGSAVRDAVSAKALAVLALFPFCWLLPNIQELLGQVTPGHFDFGGAISARVAAALAWRPDVGARLAGWGVALAGTLLAVLYYISYSTSFLYFQF
jgi:alginate O-acetyltransferase complex protein AlgI